MYYIIGSIPGEEPEIIAEYTTLTEAKRMLIEYVLSLGWKWQIYISKSKSPDDIIGE